MAAGFAGIAAAVWWAAAPVFAQETAAAAQDDAPFHLLAAEALAHGRDADAEALAAARDPDDPEAAAVLARLLIARGRYEEAEARLAPMAADAPQSAASLELALLWNHLGRRGDARPHLNAVIARAQRSRQAIDLHRGGMAARALGEFRLANSLLRAAAAGAPSDPGIQTTWGELFLEKVQPERCPPLVRRCPRHRQRLGAGTARPGRAPSPATTRPARGRPSRAR